MTTLLGEFGTGKSAKCFMCRYQSPAMMLQTQKSGYYITVNFFKQSLLLIRFGWIDAEDSIPQKSPTGQMAGLPDAVYQNKLTPIAGEYRLKAPVQLLPGIVRRVRKSCGCLAFRRLESYSRSRAICPILSSSYEKNSSLFYK